MPDSPDPAPLPARPRFSPLYRQIKGLITDALRNGDWKPGQMIPSEIELAQRYGVSQGTVRKAIDELAAENLLVRRQGKGTFVGTHHEPRSQYRFLRLHPDRGESAAPDSRVLDCRRMRAPVDVARQLGLKAGETCVQIRRLLSFDGRPVVLDEIWLPGVPFRGLTAERLAAMSGPLYGFFESEFGMRMIRCVERLRAITADETLAEILAVPVGAPLLLVDRLSYTYDDRAVEVRRGYCVTTDHHYRNELS